MKYLAILPLILILTSCADYVPIAGSLVGMAEDSVVYVKDASIAKELTVHKTLRNRDDEYGKAYKQSGTQIDFTMTEVMPGVWIQTIASISSKAPPQFTQLLPIEPSKHPLWTSLDKGIDALGKFGLAWLFVDGMKASWENSAPRYNGPVDSYNSTAEPFVVEPVIIIP